MTAVEVTAAGVDTIAHAWYVGGLESVDEWFADEERARTGTMGRVLREKVAGMTVGYFTGPQMLWAEGHAANEEAGLANHAQIVNAVARVEHELQERMFPVLAPALASERTVQGSLAAATTGRGGVRRMDATVNLEFPTSEQGIAALCGFAAVMRDRAGKNSIHYGPDRRPETVYHLGRGGKQKLGRFYDKGLESPQLGFSRGRLIRAEAQRRWTSGARPDVVAMIDDPWIAQRFKKRFETVWKATKGVTVAGTMPIAGRLNDLVASGEITALQAERLAGHLLLSRVAGRSGAGISRATMYRRETELRELGIVYGDGVLEDVEVDLTEVVEQVLGTDLWGAEG